MIRLISFAAQWLLVVPALLVAACVVARRRWLTDAVEAGVAGILTVLFVKVSGMIVVEQRPFVVERVPSLVPHVADNAFPSDHLAACGLAVAFLWPRSKALAVLALLAAAAIAYARVASRLHWPDDVAAGFVLGATAAVSARAVNGLRTRRSPVEIQR